MDIAGFFCYDTDKLLLLSWPSSKEMFDVLYLKRNGESYVFYKMFD